MFKKLIAALAISSAAAFAPNSPISTKSAVVRYGLNYIMNGGYCNGLLERELSSC